MFSFLGINKNKDVKKIDKKVNVVVTAPEIKVLPNDVSKLSPIDKKFFDEISSWVSVKVSNQPTISKNPQTIKLPLGWTAREDYLLTVIPTDMPADLRNFRTIIMRPDKTKIVSREDAIYIVPDASNKYFKDHCNLGEVVVCYGGKNVEIKHVFDLMFYFSKK
ncbi:hypothetical protein K8Q94_02640 [Candidatus Nomurabacteria bacterium]|nr:hypothetical protein [Candidatus Nomurabacteria bacterium]